MPLGAVCPPTTEFIFEKEDDLDAEAKRLAKFISEYGVAYVKTMANYESLAKEILLEVRNSDYAKLRYVAALWIGGKQAEAVEFMKQNKNSGITDKLPDQFIKLEVMLRTSVSSIV